MSSSTSSFVLGSLGSWWRERTWMKWMSSPSISVMNCGSAFSLASALRQS